MGYSPQGRKESETSKRLTLTQQQEGKEAREVLHSRTQNYCKRYSPTSELCVCVCVCVHILNLNLGATSFLAYF